MTETISAAARIAMSHSEEISPDQAGYEIRPAQVADLPQLQELVDRFVQANRLLPRTADELHDLVPSGFVAIAEGHVVGFAALEIYSPKLAEIRSLAVDPGYHGRGIGRGLVSRCVQLAVSRNVLEVMAITSSDGFFKACGFDFTLPGEKKALFIQTRDEY
jgi:N-acetylglutamate synthase-like GNAT family acetyltransferase